jgi:hypothetical protein
MTPKSRGAANSQAVTMLISSPEQVSFTDSSNFSPGNSPEAISVIITIADWIPKEQPSPPTIPIINYW